MSMTCFKCYIKMTQLFFLSPRVLGLGSRYLYSTVRSERAAVDIAAPGGGLCAARQLLSAKIESLSSSLRYQLFRRSRRQPPGRSVGWIKQLSGFILQYKCSGIFLFYLAASKQLNFSIKDESRLAVSVNIISVAPCHPSIFPSFHPI